MLASRNTARTVARRAQPLLRQARTLATTAILLQPTPVPEWASPQARLAAEGLLNRWHAYDAHSKPATEYTQTLDANQLGLLRVLVEQMVPLSSRSGKVAPRRPASDPEASGADVLRGEVAKLPAQGEALLPAEHLVYFTPRVPTAVLAPDGSDPSFNPPGGIFTRRMWAGGEIDFLQPNRLCVGAEVRERTFVEDALVKRMGGGKGDEMLVVWLRKEYEVRGEVVLRDRRSWVFRKALATPSGSFSSPAPPARHSPPMPSTDPESGSHSDDGIVLAPSPADLFRFSALTYNAHQIHLDSAWARTVEGHSDVVVHGPLNVLLLCRFWLSLQGGEKQRRIAKVIYRAKSPVCAHEPYRLVRRLPSSDHGASGGPDVLQAVRTDSGKVIMEAIIHSIAA